MVIVFKCSFKAPWKCNYLKKTGEKPKITELVARIEFFQTYAMHNRVDPPVCRRARLYTVAPRAEKKKKL